MFFANVVGRMKAKCEVNITEYRNSSRSSRLKVTSNSTPEALEMTIFATNHDTIKDEFDSMTLALNLVVVIVIKHQ
ncbi:CLUMA_CG000303, isoform A [Clunio marinus]|uniref:CLUMA_CG000303, isoform A n=1 Tax=Clunio marinus TaxID=568069 RepID=A0A1J1HEX3_9DIPT|nr:CLUMA_CG000303, isoform A [Clunio marinus]